MTDFEIFYIPLAKWRIHKILRVLRADRRVPLSPSFFIGIPSWVCVQ